MNEGIENGKPCLVETAQGFSVSYSEKFLYSKYDPAKTIVRKIESMEILPGSVILGFSAVLSYGLKELISKLPENCVLLLCEVDSSLRDFTTEMGKDEILPPFAVRLTEEELYQLPVILQKASYTFACGKEISFAGNFRRVIRIDFSAGVQFHSDFYNRLESACIASVKQFWTNRITLAKFGRRYSSNLFRNLKVLSETEPLESFFRSVEKPVYVFGSGESSEKGIAELKKSSSDVYILCADTAFPMLKAHGIIPDGIVVDEAQSVIAQSFIGARNTVKEAEKQGVHVFQSLCSLPHVAGRHFPKERTSFYATEYASNSFFSKLKESSFFPPVIPAFGSVGITTYILALLFRKNDSVPLFVYGLDFAYSSGKTHARGTPAHKRQLRSMNRMKAVENFGASYGASVLRLPEGMPYPFTTPVLSGYAETFRQVKEQGAEIAGEILKKPVEVNNTDVSAFIDSEKKALIELRDLLSGKTEMAETERSEKIRRLLENRQYLYLHFPDGYRMSMELNFLKRIRSEIDGFLKIMG